MRNQKRVSAPAKLGAVKGNDTIQKMLNEGLFLGNSPVPSRKTSPNKNSFNWSVPNTPMRRISPPKSKPKSKSKPRGLSLKKAFIGALLLSAPGKAGYKATGTEIRAGHGMPGTGMVPYAESVAVNVPLPGTVSYPAHQKMLFYNNTRQPPKGFIKQLYNRAKTALTRRPKKMTMNNLRGKYFAGKAKTGAPRKTVSVINVYTLPSTENVILYPNLYTANVVATAQNAFRRGNKVFSNKNFKVQTFSKKATNQVKKLQGSKAPKIKSKYIVSKSF